MASPFAKYQSEQVQQIAPGFVEAFAKSGQAIGQGIASIGQSVAQGITEADKRKKEEIALKAKLAPYIRNDQRIQVTEGLFKAGILTKAPDGTAVVSADYVGKVDMAALEKNLSFYNQTGGDGSKLSGNNLIEFTSRLEAEQKYVADQAAKVKAGLDLDLQRAQIEKLRAEAAAKAATTGNYANVIDTLLGGESAPSSTLPTITLPDGTSGVFSQGVPVSKAATTEPGVAAPAVAPAASPAAAPAAAEPAPAAISPALTAGTKAKAKDEVADKAAPAEEPTEVPAAYAPVPEPGPLMTEASPDAKKAREINKLTDEQMVLNEYLMALDRDRVKYPIAGPILEAVGRIIGAEHIAEDADGNVVVSGKDSKVIRQRFAANAKRLVELRGEGEAAAPAAEPTVSPALREGTTGTPAAAAPAEQVAAPAAEATPAAEPAPLEQRATAAGTPIPETYDVAAKAADVQERMQAIQARRTQVRTTYATRRTALEGQIAVANRNLKSGLPSNKEGMNMAQAALAYSESRRKDLDEAEARDLKALDDEADSIKTEFTNYQAAATAARQGRTEDRLGRAEQREIERDKAALTKAERDLRVGVAKDYPMISVFTYQGYGMKDPSTIGIQPMPLERYTEASEQIKGYNSAQDFLLNMKGILREREGASGNRLKEITQRFRITAGNMENYFKAELASVFGVAAFRKPIVSGGNFSDADREFVRQAITYLNTAAPDMSNKDLESSLKALSFMINGLYQSQIEGLGMTYNPEAAKARATALTTGGDKVGGATVSKQVERTDRFYKAFNLNQGSASSISRAEIDAARARLEATGFKFSAAKAKADNEAALKAAAGK